MSGMNRYYRRELCDSRASVLLEDIVERKNHYEEKEKKY